ncbi:MAG: hypothetical protein HY508_07195 [Acidobacteria bacterium]|nr:hypothetical protein [Acidobacteriota bacterium]
MWEVPDVPGQFPDRGVPAQVVYTNHAATVGALHWVARLGISLGMRSVVLMFYAVPGALPLDWQSVPKGFLENRIRALKEATATEFSVRVYLCRHSRQILRKVLGPDSLVVVGGKRRWWPTDEQRLAEIHKKDGHQVFLVNST